MMKHIPTTHKRRLRGAFGALLAGAVLAAAPPAFSAEELKDTDIANALEFELLLDHAVPSNEIEAEVADGIVTLRGSSTHLLGKERAARVAETVKGVRSVINLIDVQPTEGLTGEELREDVNAALLSDPATESYEIKVEASDKGKVTLSGTVDSWQENDLALKVAKSVRGVTSVVDEITVDYASDRPDFEIQQDIEARLRWNTLVDDALIDVEVEDGAVTLSGTVGSAAEKRQARYNAWAVAGVGSVSDSQLTVERWARDDDLRTKKYVSKSPGKIEEALKDAFLYDPRVLSFDITPEVSPGGTVTLRGKVDNLAAKRAAEQVARHTVGVSRVQNFIKVRPEDGLTDPQIKANVVSRLAVDPLVESFEINVEVKAGTAYLRGTVDSLTEKLQAEDVASRAKGVSNVANYLVVADAEDITTYDPYVWDYGWTDLSAPQPATSVFDDAEIEEDINSQIFWSPFVDQEDVDVSVENGVATLTGEVDSPSERVAAMENALEGGAVRLNNKIKLK